MFNGRTTNKFSELHGIEVFFKENIMDNEIKAAKMKKKLMKFIARCRKLNI